MPVDEQEKILRPILEEYNFRGITDHRTITEMLGAEYGIVYGRVQPAHSQLRKTEP